MLKKGIKAAFCLIVLTLFCFTPAVSMAGTKVGYINLQKLVQESELGKSALREIEVLKKTKQMEISQKMKQINEVKIDLETRSDDLSEQDKKDRIDILNDSIKDYKTDGGRREGRYCQGRARNTGGCPEKGRRGAEKSRRKKTVYHYIKRPQCDRVPG